MKKIPSVVQLPGGVRLKAIPFIVVRYDDEGRPMTFERAPMGTPITKGVYALFAHEESLNIPGQDKK